MSGSLVRLLPDDETTENLPPAFSSEEPVSVPVDSSELVVESWRKLMSISRICGVISLQEERIRSCAWTVVGAMFDRILLAH